jgi:hypothetical protein
MIARADQVGELGPAVGDLDVFSPPFLFQNAAYTGKALWTRLPAICDVAEDSSISPVIPRCPPVKHPATSLFGGEM